MEKDVGLQRSHEEQRRGARVFDAQDAGLGGAAEVVGDDAQAAARRRVLGTDVERQHDRRLRAAVHVDGEVLGDGVGDEGNELFGEAAENDARILRAAGDLQLDDGRRKLDVPRAHGRGEESLLRMRVAEEGGGGDAELVSDVGERGGLETFRGEDAAGSLEEAFTGDRRRPAH